MPGFALQFLAGVLLRGYPVMGWGTGQMCNKALNLTCLLIVSRDTDVRRRTIFNNPTTSNLVSTDDYLHH
jgi:hypothetical protein